MSARWAVIREAFDLAADADDQTRQRILETLAVDPSTRDELAALLKAHDRRTVLEDEPPLLHAGPFVLHESLGRGGFGEVFRAEQSAPVARPAAVKILHESHRAGQVVARFALEQHTLARLDHPCIARLFEAGVTDDGRPWFAMQLVRGERIDRFASGSNPRQLCELIAGVADALHHAHQRAVIHRDVKPSNILVEQTDSGPVARLIDFGVAKALDADAQHGLTIERHQVGTPAYMSPEQMAGGFIGTQTDIYALGAVFYDLLARTPPSEGGVHPDRSQPLQATSPTDRRLFQAIDPVLRKAMARQEADRYASADSMARDLRAVLRGERTSVGAASPVQLLRWSLRRHPIGWGSTVILTVGLIGAAVGATYGLLKARSERDAAKTAAGEARRQREGAEAALTILEQTLTGIDPDIALGRDTSLLLDRTHNALAQLDAGALTNQPEAEGRLRVLIAQALSKLGRSAEAESVALKAMDLTREKLGPSNWTSRQAALAWINSLYELGRYADASAAAARTMADAPAPGPDATDRQRTIAVDERQIWSEAALAVGDAVGARRFSDESIAIVKTLTEPNADYESRVLFQAAQILAVTGDSKQAVVLAERALAAVSRAFQPPHPALARAHNEVGTYLEDEGRTEEALSHKRAALEMARLLFPPVDNRTALALDNIATTLAKLGREDEARATMDQSLAMFRALYVGRDHPDLARALDHAAIRHAVGGDTAGAESLAREGLAMRQRLVPTGDSEVARSQVTLARVLAVSGKIDEAEPYFLDAIKLRRRIASGADRLDVAHTAAVYGQVLLAAGRVSNAEEPLRDAVETGLRLFPVEQGLHPEVAQWAASLRSCLLAQGKAAEADALALRLNSAK